MELKQRVTEGEEPGRNRPRMEEQHTPGILKHLITKCWSTDITKRYSFETLKTEKSWEKAKMDSVSDGSKVHEPLLRIFEKSKPVSFKFFLDRFSALLDEPIKLYFDREDPNRGITPEIRLLSYLLEIGNMTKDRVQKEDVLRLLNWFSKKMSKKDYLPTLYKLCSEPYFFGRMSSELSYPLFNDSKNGKFLLRYSDSDKNWILDFKVNGTVKSDIIQTESIAELLKKDFPEKLLVLHLKPHNYVKKGRPIELTNLLIKEEKFFTGNVGYGPLTQVNDKNFQYIDLYRTSSLSHYNFILDDKI